jgi:hypothetical protein
MAASIEDVRRLVDQTPPPNDLQIGGGFAVLAGIFVARPKLQIPAPAEPKGASPPKPVAPST